MTSKHIPDTASANSALDTAREPSRRDHLPYQVRHLDEIDWETIRWPGETGKMLFHPTPGAADRAQCRHPAARAGRASSRALSRLRPGLVHPQGRVHDRRQALPAGHHALPPRPAFRGRVRYRDRRRDPDRAVSRPVDRRAADLCRAVQHGGAQGDRRGDVSTSEASGPALSGATGTPLSRPANVGYTRHTREAEVGMAQKNREISGGGDALRARRDSRRGER